jgi:hypothetical protein
VQDQHLDVAATCGRHDLHPRQRRDRIVVLFHEAVRNVFDTTYLGIEFIFAANPASSSMDGHAAANPS